MGSITGSVGDKAGMRVPLVGSGQSIVLPSLYLATYPTIANLTFQYCGLEFGWRAGTFQLIPGTAAGLSVNIGVTLDQATAQGSRNPGAWEALPQPAASTGEWSNPLVQGAGTQLARIDSGPWVAIILAVTATTLTPASNAAILVAAAA